MIDGVAHVHIAVAFAVGAQIAHGGKAGAQIGLRFFQGEERPGFVRGGHALAGGERVIDMRMAVDQAGQDRCVAQVNHFGSGGNLDAIGGADAGDAVAADEHDLVGEIGARLRVKETAGADHEASEELPRLWDQRTEEAANAREINRPRRIFGMNADGVTRASLPPA